MAIFESTVFTHLRKSFGNVTTCVSRGMNILRTKTTIVNNPNTLEQRKQRLRMKELVDLSLVFYDVCNLGFPRHRLGETPLNVFVRLNMQAVSVSEKLEVTLQYDRLVCSEGRLKAPDVSVSGEADAHRLVFTPTAQEYALGKSPDVSVYAVMFEKARREVQVDLLCKAGESEPVNVELPGNWDPDEIAVYVFTLAADKRSASPTVCVKV